jgi:hypothetical protein
MFVWGPGRWPRPSEWSRSFFFVSLCGAKSRRVCSPFSGYRDSVRIESLAPRLGLRVNMLWRLFKVFEQSRAEPAL